MEATPSAREAGITHFDTGAITSDGTAVTVTLGYTPRHVKIVNITDVIIWEKLAGMSSTQSVKVVTAGTTTIDTGSAIVLGTNGFTISATAAGTSKSLVWFAE